MMKISYGWNNTVDYRQAEAMYRRGCSAEDIARSIGIPLYSALDYIQKIFALDMKKKGRW